MIADRNSGDENVIINNSLIDEREWQSLTEKLQTVFTDYGERKTGFWRLNQLLTWLLIGLLFVASAMVFIGGFRYTIMIWVLCCGIWLSKHISAPMEKYLACAAVSTKAYEAMMDCHRLKGNYFDDSIDKETFLSALKIIDCNWDDFYSKNAM